MLASESNKCRRSWHFFSGWRRKIGGPTEICTVYCSKIKCQEYSLRKRQCNEKNKAKVLSSDWAILSNRLIFFRPISLAPKTVPEYNKYLFSNTCQALKGHQGPRDEDTALFFKELWLSEGWRRKSKKKVNVYLLLGKHQGEWLTLPRAIREDFREEAILEVGPEGWVEFIKKRKRILQVEGTAKAQS